MSWEEELRPLARERENAAEAGLLQMIVDHPRKLLRQLRSYLGEQTDHGRLKHTPENLRITTVEGALQELACDEIEFSSDSRLTFNIQMEQAQGGWLVKRFKFHLHLSGRSIPMLRIHLNPEGSHDPLSVPRCHLHIGDSKAHIPFPIMSARLMLHLLCEHIEPDLGL